MMNSKRLFFLFTSYLALTLLALFLATLFTTRAVHSFHIRTTTNDLQARAQLIKDQVTDLFASGQWPQLEQLCQNLGQKSATRITVIALDGQVAADSLEDPALMDNHATRPEIITALQGRIGASSRYSHTIHKNLRYVALPLLSHDEIVASLRLSVPLSSLDAALSGIRLTLILGALAVALLIAFVTWFISYQITRPVQAMRNGARRFANRDFTTPIPVRGPDELMDLSRCLNAMAIDLSSHIATVVNQRNELETIFSSMIEGVFTVDEQERIISINQAAADFLESTTSAARGHTLLEIMRNSDLKLFMRQTLSASSPVRQEITLRHRNQDSFTFAAHGVLLPPETSPSKAMVVLNDITRLKKLENIRRDFVANVSHELKTPITAIQGYVETLIAGAIADPDHNLKFLTIIQNHALRLSSIIHDLLTLSRLEEDNSTITLTSITLLPLINAAINACQPLALAKQINLAVHGPADIMAMANQPLLEMALINLITNAITYSPPESVIDLKLQLVDNIIKIKIIDSGEGIAAAHHQRIFERFYRVDQGRSRDAGGTGLGLAIVKHIILAHHGQILVDSRPGQGSTFTIILPFSAALRENLTRI